MPFLLILAASVLQHPLHASEDNAIATLDNSPQHHIAQVTEPWHGTQIRDLHQQYGNIFKHGNRNAASHLWSKFLLERSEQMTHEALVTMFSGYCAVSGSPTRPSEYTRYRLTLDRVDGKGKTSGFMYYCCWPCVCDTQDFIKVDTRNVTTADGTRTYRFAVLGNPCDHPEKLHEPFQQPFNYGRGMSTIAQDAAEVRCDGGRLINAPLSDHGYIIIGMFFDVPGQSAANDWHDELPLPMTPVQPGRLTDMQGTKYQDEHEYAPMCQDRANNGYNSGMGEIFRRVGAISPIPIQTPPTIQALPGVSDTCASGDCKGHTAEL